MRRLIAWLLAAMGLVAACQSPGPRQEPTVVQESEPVNPAAPTTLRYYIRGAPGFDDYIINAFEKAHPDIRVEKVSPEGNPLAQVSGLIAEEKLDVIMGAWVSLPELARQHQLLDLQPFLQRDGIELAPQERARQIEGRVYWLPVLSIVDAVFYNPELFDQAGLEPPDPNWTWDDFRLTVAELHDRLGAQGVRPISTRDSDMLYKAMVYQQWRDTPVPEPEAVARALQTTATLVHDGLLPPPADLDEVDVDDFRQGKAVIMPGSVEWLRAPVLGETWETWDAVPFPRFADTENWLRVSPFSPVGIAATTPNRDAAWELVRFIAGDAGAAVTASANFIPPRITPEVSAIYREAGVPPQFLRTLEGPRQSSPVFGRDDLSIVQLALGLGREVIVGEKDADQAVAEYQQAYEQWRRERTEP